MTADDPEALTGEVPEDEHTASFRGLLSTLIDALKTRLDLLTVESEIYLRRVLQALIWAFAAISCALLAFVFVIVAVIAVLWDTHRMLGILSGAAFFVVLAGIFGAMSTRRMRGRPPILEHTIDELEHDRQRMRGTG
jgi:uncharacterized membrane protein YqjE